MHKVVAVGCTYRLIRRFKRFLILKIFYFVFKSDNCIRRGRLAEPVANLHIGGGARS